MRLIAIPFRFTAPKVWPLPPPYDEVVRGQVIDALMTNQGERVFRPRYGCDIQSALFDPRDELVRRDAAAIIRKRLEDFVPRCIVRNITVEAPVDQHGALCQHHLQAIGAVRRDWRCCRCRSSFFSAVLMTPGATGPTGGSA